MLAATPAFWVVGQVVRTSYGKATRGGAGATARARRAHGFALPDAMLVLDDHRVHAIEIQEWREVSRLDRTRSARPRAGERTIALPRPFGAALTDTGLLVTGDRDRLIGRRSTARLPLALAPAQWVRLLANRRELSYDASWYEELAINLGVFARPPHPRVFCQPPPRVIDLRVDLLRRGVRGADG